MKITHTTHMGELHVKFEVSFDEDFEKMELKNVTQVYGFVFNDKHQVAVVLHNSDHWIMPGGGVEKGESLRETLKREVYEETAIKISNESIEPFFYQESYIEKDGKWEFENTQVRFLARVESMDEFKGDPDGDISEFKFVDPIHLHDILEWGDVSKEISRRLS